MPTATLNRVRSVLLERLTNIEQLTPWQLQACVLMSLVVYGGVVIEPVWLALSQRLLKTGAIQRCGSTIWLPYELEPGANELANMRNTKSWTLHTEDRCYPDTISLAFLCALSHCEAFPTTPLSWIGVAREFSLSQSFEAFSELIINSWPTERHSRITSYLSRILSGQYKTIGLDHQRYRVWVSGVEAPIETRRFGSEPVTDKPADDHYSQDYKRIRQALSTPSQTRPQACRQLQALLPSLSIASHSTVAWLIMKMERKEIKVSTAKAYLSQLGPAFLNLMSAPPPLATRADKQQLLEQLSAIYGEPNEHGSNQLSIDRACQVLADLNSKRISHGRSAQFVNTSRILPSQFATTSQQPADDMTELNWWAWLTLLREAGLREGEIYQIRRADATFCSDGSMDVHVHRHTKTRNANRQVKIRDTNTQLFVAMKSWMANTSKPLLMPSDKNWSEDIVSQKVNAQMRCSLLDEDAVAHSLRHSYVCEKFSEIVLNPELDQTRLTRLDQRLDELATRVGHGSIETTLLHYIHNAAEVISQRLNLMTPRIANATMAQLTRRRYKQHRKTQRPHDFQRRMLVETLAHYQHTTTLRSRSGRPKHPTPPISNPELLLELLRAEIQPFTIPEWDALKTRVKARLSSMLRRYPGLSKNGQPQLPRPRSDIEQAWLERALESALQQLESGNTNASELLAVVASFDTKARPAGCVCATVTQAKQILKVLLRVMPNNTEISATVCHNNSNTRTDHTTWQKRLPMLNIVGRKGETGGLSIRVTHGNRTSTAMRAWLILIGYYLSSRDRQS